MAAVRTKYYSISRRCENNLKGYIAYWLYLEDLQRFEKKIVHIDIQNAYEQIINKLPMIEDRFYEICDTQIPRKPVTKENKRQFAVQEIINILDRIYRLQNYRITYNEELTSINTNLDSEEEPFHYPVCTPNISKIRLICAKKIWINWTNERHWGPRVGVILIYNTAPGEEKVLLISYTIKNILHCGFPKGKPNNGESVRMGAFREFKEETHAYDLNHHLHINEDNGVIIKKYPHVGSLNRSRTHHYVLTTTSVQYTSFQPDGQEVDDIEWHSIYTIPCCNDCKISRKYRFIKGSNVPINYHMVTLRDIDNKNPVILEILAYIDANNENREARSKYFHLHRSCEHDLN